MPASLLDIQPHSPDAERTLLGAILLDPEQMIEVSARVRPADFYDPAYRSIYAAMCRLQEARQPIDFVTIAEALATDDSVQKIGGSAFLAEIASSVGTSSHAPHYAAIVGDKALHRKLIDVGSAIQTLGQDVDLPALDALERAEQK